MKRPVVSFITAFRPFDSFYGPIQRSTLFSYSCNEIPVVTPNIESDTYYECLRFQNVRFFDGVRTAQNLGFKNTSPVIRDMLILGLDKIQSPFVGLINSDVLIPENFQDLVVDAFEKNGSDAFIAVTRYDVDLLSEVRSIEDMRKVYQQEFQTYDEACSSDLFLGSKENFLKMAMEMPEFILGRYAWDNWIHYFMAVNLNHFNGTEKFNIRHFRHGHEHILAQEGKSGRQAPSSIYNIGLLRDMQDHYGLSCRINDWPKL